MDNVRFVVAGYVLTGVALGAYAFSLFRRARHARERTEAIARRQNRSKDAQ